MNRFLALLPSASLLPSLALAQDLVSEQQPSTVSVVKDGAGIRINTVNRRYEVNVYGSTLKDQVIERQLLLIEQTVIEIPLRTIGWI